MMIPCITPNCKGEVKASSARMICEQCQARIRQQINFRCYDMNYTTYNIKIDKYKC